MRPADAGEALFPRAALVPWCLDPGIQIRLRRFSLKAARYDCPHFRTPSREESVPRGRFLTRASKSGVVIRPMIGARRASQDLPPGDGHDAWDGLKAVPYAKGFGSAQRAMKIGAA